MRLLVAEDEQDLNLIISRKLKDEGYAVDSCFDGEEAIDCIDAADYDGIVLDIMMPLADGFEVLSHLRKNGKKTPVLFLTAKDSIADKVKGLDSGANDYLVKPFSFDELCARIRAMTRASVGNAQTSVLTLDDLAVDLASHKVTRGEKNIELSAKEYALLIYLLKNAGTVISREKIEDHIWNFEYEGGTNVVDVYISYLRRKIDDGHKTKLIHTIRGRGYVMRENK